MSALPIRPFRVTKNLPLAPDVFLLSLEPADGEPVFSFTAGQWIMAYLDDPDGGTPWRGAMSIASAPSESQDGIEMAVKVYGDFTKRLQRSIVGDVIRIHGPFGVFVLKPGTDRLVMFAAGIGITPFRSMIRECLAMNDPREIVLVYSNRETGAVFENEFRDLAATHSNFHPIFLLTGTPLSQWNGEVGRLNAEKLERFVPDVGSTEFLMCGSVGFMQTVTELLAARGVDVKTKLRKELFS